MSETILSVQGDRFTRVPCETWEESLVAVPEHAKTVLAFMTGEHHLVRNFAVRELPRAGAPLPPESISERLGLPLEKVQAILEDLERHMTFLFRNREGAVAWAYPVTVDPTPHRVSFSTGERLFAA